MRRPFFSPLSVCVAAFGVVVVVGVGDACTLVSAGSARLCDVDDDCGDGGLCQGGFCNGGSGAAEGEGENPGEGEGENPGEGEGENPGEGEGENPGEGEGENPGEGEGEGETPLDPPPQTVCSVSVREPWADQEFPFRIPVGICDAGAPDVVVADATVMVRIRGTDIDFDTLRNAGTDIAFYDQRGTTLTRLTYERQIFNKVAGTGDEAVFQVKVPNLNPRLETDVIWMYWGSANPTDVSDPAGTYTSYNAVWHFDDAAGAVRLPEAKSGEDSRVLGLNDGATTDVGVVGRALDLNGSAFAVLDDTTVASQVGAVNPFGLTGAQGSFSFLVGPRVGDAAGMSIGQTIFFADGGDPRSQGFDQRSVHVTIASSTDNGNGPADSIGFSMPTTPARPANPSFVASAAGVIDRNAFNHILASWSPTGVQLYVNGTLVADQAATGFAMTLRFIDVGTSQELARVLRGRIDELRASNTTRNAAFARLEAKSIRGELTQLGTVQNRP